MRRLVIATSLAAVLPFTPNPAQQPAPAAKPAADTARSKTDSLPLTPTRKVDFTTSDRLEEYRNRRGVEVLGPLTIVSRADDWWTAWSQFFF